jgi:hypothetical protein
MKTTHGIIDRARSIWMNCAVYVLAYNDNNPKSCPKVPFVARGFLACTWPC